MQSTKLFWAFSGLGVLVICCAFAWQLATKEWRSFVIDVGQKKVQIESAIAEQDNKLAEVQKQLARIEEVRAEFERNIQAIRTELDEAKAQVDAKRLEEVSRRLQIEEERAKSIAVESATKNIAEAMDASDAVKSAVRGLSF